MILGIGIDIVRIDRIETIFQKFPNIFPSKILGKNEKNVFIKIPDHNKINYLAKRFSAKESLVKACSGLGIHFSFTEINIMNMTGGKPFFVFHDDSKFSKYKIDISLSDDYPYAVSLVIISSLY